MSETVEGILSLIREKRFLLNELKTKTESEINELNDKLYKICHHDWIIDYSNCGEHTEFICNKCFLYK